MPERLWVVNSSPIISLAKIRHLHILPALCGKMFVVPRAVEQELLAGPEDDPARCWITTEAGQQWVRDVGPIDPLVAAWDLGAGESEVLSWSRRNPAYQAVLDDLAARKFAQTFGISLCGTIGVIVTAKKAGIISSVAPLLTGLINAGLRIDSCLHQTALRLAGETAQYIRRSS